MTPKEFTIRLQQINAETEQAINDDLPVIAGKIAVDHFKENFENESFDDEPWQEVKRREGERTGRARDTRKILTGETGDLGESPQYEKTAAAEVTISSDLEYADAHNEGCTDAGRNRNVTIPQRKFIGESEVVNEEIENEIEDLIGGVLRK